MKKICWIIGLLGVVMLGVVGWFWYYQPINISVSEQKINAKLSERLPIVKKYLGLLVLEVYQVNVSLIPVTHTEESPSTSARVSVEAKLKLTTKNPLASDDEKYRVFQAVVQGSGAIRYDPIKGALLIDQFQLGKILIPELPEKYQHQAEILVTEVLGAYLKTHPAYVLNQSDMKQNLAKLLLKDVQVLPPDLVIILGH